MTPRAAAGQGRSIPHRRGTVARRQAGEGQLSIRWSIEMAGIFDAGGDDVTVGARDGTVRG
jgi:hypothetical protein